MKNINTEYFETISLQEMDKVQFMNRTDTKFFFHIDELESLLKSIKDDYYILQIEGVSKMPYTSLYFDTEKNSMFTAHQNGKLNRFKIRKRTYKTSGLNFLEVKFKNNKGRTIKSRIPISENGPGFNKTEQEFIKKLTPFSTEDLHASLENSYHRIMLVNKQFNERCSIDFNLSFKNEHGEQSLNDLVIAEVKANGSSFDIPLIKALRNKRIKASGFSKYCIGVALTDNSVKKNTFKPKIRRLERTIHTNLIAG
jgi:hypothetical protein